MALVAFNFVLSESNKEQMTRLVLHAQTLQARHDMALELLGERNERVEALEDDIREMKHIFHSQLSALVDELNALKLKQ